MSDCCGFFNILQPGNVVLADRELKIEEDLKFYGAKLEIPAFTRGKKQLSLEEVEHSNRLSSVMYTCGKSHWSSQVKIQDFGRSSASV